MLLRGIHSSNAAKKVVFYIFIDRVAVAVIQYDGNCFA